MYAIRSYYASGYNNYYLISVYNDRTEKLSAIRTFVQRIDSFPPDAPIKLSAVIDSFRITSYNVCYTKLLRINVAQADAI